MIDARRADPPCTPDRPHATRRIIRRTAPGPWPHNAGRSTSASQDTVQGLGLASRATTKTALASWSPTGLRAEDNGQQRRGDGRPARAAPTLSILSPWSALTSFRRGHLRRVERVELLIGALLQAFFDGKHVHHQDRRGVQQ
eukprot:scaffold21812_cov110-Isochrysis_galbana.AAC.12